METLKKVITVIVCLVLIGFALHLGKRVPSEPVQEVPIVEPDLSKGIFTTPTFTFEYDTEVIANDYNETSPWRTNSQTPGDFHVGILIPGSIQPNTNFREAKFTVGSSADSEALTSCLVPTNGERAKGEVVINGALFKKITLSEGAAGNYYDTTSYRTIYNGKCYAIDYTIHSLNIRNYSPEQNIQEFNTQAIVNILETMVQSFRFL